ncbi:MAG: hypothetical protein IAE97_09255 [Chthoniobacterales bacterium]|nr:hypothetical protein [Chthoniobacterales bacterium]
MERRYQARIGRRGIAPQGRPRGGVSASGNASGTARPEHAIISRIPPRLDQAHRTLKLLVCLLAALASLLPAHAAETALWLPSLFSDRMVLQQGKPVPVWGRAAPGDTVKVRFETREASALADEDGRWKAVLAPLKASKTGADLTISTGGETRTIRDVVVGEVWLMSGQSNMALLMSAIPGTPEILGSETRAEAAKAPKGPSIVKAEADMAAANDPLLRTYRVQDTSAERQREDAVTRTGWMEWNKENAGGFSAMAAYFGESLRAALDVPVGIVMCSWGGSSACSWISPETLRSPPLNGYFPEDVPEWGSNLAPGRLYNGMLRPVAPLAISGFCWYQGETDATELQNAFVHRHLLTSLIRDWRRAWREDALPFYIVQLPPRTKGERWEVVRESQAFATAEPGTAMIPTVDIVPPGDLHPKNKFAVAQRLAALVLGDHYGQKTWPGLTKFQRAEKDGAAMRVHFQGGDGGLKTSDNKPPREFQVAGEDRVFKPAEAVIEGSTVVVKSSEVPQPVAVRYAWAEAPEVNMFNTGGLPVAPFRSDDWPVAGQEMVPQSLPGKAQLANVTAGKNLASQEAAPWILSEAAADPKFGEMFLSCTQRAANIQVRGFPPRRGFPASPVVDWTARPEIDPARGLTLEAAVQVNTTGSSGFNIEAGVRQADGTIRRYQLAAFPSRLITFRNFLGGRVPESTETHLLRSDLDEAHRILRIAIRPDGVAQIYDGGKIIGTTTGETVPGDSSYLRIGKSTEGGKCFANITHLAFDTGGAFAPQAP